MEWQGIESAPKDGSPVQVRRIYQGRIVYDGPAEWRKVHFGELREPIDGTVFAEAYDDTGWMRVDSEHRVPEPTHWLPAPPA